MTLKGKGFVVRLRPSVLLRTDPAFDGILRLLLKHHRIEFDGVLLAIGLLPPRRLDRPRLGAGVCPPLAGYW